MSLLRAMKKPPFQKLLGDTVFIEKQLFVKIYDRLKSRLDNFLGTFGRYSAILKVITADSIWRFKKESFLILITSFLGVFFQVWTIGLVIYYAQALEKGNNIKLFGYVFQTRTSIGLLFVCGTGILVSLLLSAWLIYFSRTKGFFLGRRYEVFCSKRILSTFGSSLKVWAPPDRNFSDSSIVFRLARKDSRDIGRVLWMLLDTVIPVITLLVSVGVLFYTNTPLTFLMLALFGISSIFQYKISVMGAKNSVLREKHARGASLEYQQIILRLKGSSLPLPRDESWFEKEVFTAGKLKRYLNAHIGRLTAVENSQLISNILFAITIFVLLLTLGAGSILKGEGWGNLIIYLVALRFGLTNMKQSSKKITSINRFYPQVRRYFQFLENTTTPITKESYRNNHVVTAGTKRIDGSLSSFNLMKGSRIGLISTVELNRYTLAFIIDCLLGHSQQAVRNALGSMWFTTSKCEYLPGTLRESLGLPPGYEWQDIRREIEDAGLWNKAEQQLPHNLEEPISSDLWNRIDPDLKVALALVNAIHSDHLWVTLEENALQFLSDTTLTFFLNRLSDRILVIVFYENTKALGRYGEDVIAVIGDGSIAGLGSRSWFTENQQRIEDISKSRFTKNLHKSTMDIDSDDEFDDEDM